MAPQASEADKRYRPAPLRLPGDIFKRKEYRGVRVDFFDDGHFEPDREHVVIHDDGSAWHFVERGDPSRSTPSTTPGMTFATHRYSLRDKLSVLAGVPPGADLSTLCSFNAACLPDGTHNLFDRFFWANDAAGEVVSSGSAGKMAFGAHLGGSGAPKDQAYSSAIALMAFLLCRPESYSYRGALLGTGAGYLDRVKRTKQRPTLDLVVLGDRCAPGDQYETDHEAATRSPYANHPDDWPDFLFPNLARSFDLIEIAEGAPHSHVIMPIDKRRPSKLLIHALPSHLAAWISAFESSGEWPSFGPHYYTRDYSALFLKPLDLVQPDTLATRRAEATRLAADRLSVRKFEGQIRRDAARAELVRRYGKGADDV